MDCSETLGKIVVKQCARCGSGFESYTNAARLYCSRSCASKATYKPITTRPVWTPPGSAPKATCPSCNKEFRQRLSGGRRAKWCSATCRANATVQRHDKPEWLERKAAASRLRAERMAAECESRRLDLEVKRTERSAALQARKEAVSQAPCVDCGAVYNRNNGHALRCEECRKIRNREVSRPARRVEKAKRRAIERGTKAERIDPLMVFQRDRWTCCLCGQKTPKARRGSYHSNAPELDHIISLSEGGTHAWSNVQCL